MVTPPKLQAGDTVAMVATARSVQEKELSNAIDFLENLGLRILIGSSIGPVENQFAGSDEIRSKDLQQMLDHPQVKAIWCAKGGYGTVRILDSLDFSSFLNNPKWIIGYSDITALHCHIQGLGVESLHAQIALGLEHKTKETLASIKKVLFDEPYSISYTVEEKNKNRIGEAEGELIGGNLSVLYSLIGSSSSPKTDGKILFIEDLDEYLYHIDRMMQNLKRNGMLKNLRGLIVGGMNNMNDNTIPFGKTAEEIIREAVSAYDYPVCFNFPAGHIEDNRALILGRNGTLAVTENSVSLTF
ncbi:S66 peptidase family protein [Luteirhabdus pelagi]|uniref:S66 peptidase family protein n=1 Tax=Luteirhabdus pelagi TaxID=2792783 RepID=UPI0019398A6B|nr:LD-carboxypeptidase [Luteirhabdus pelagi]